MNTFVLNSQISQTIALVIKPMAIVALVVYAIFAFILISQIRNKRMTVATELGPILEFLAYIHLVLSIGIIILSFIIL